VKFIYIISVTVLVISYQNCAGSFKSIAGGGGSTQSGSGTPILGPSDDAGEPTQAEPGGTTTQPVGTTSPGAPPTPPAPAVDTEAVALAKSLVAYEESLYQTLSDNNCNFCHKDNAYPFLGGNSLDSHNYLLRESFIDLASPERSSLYLKAVSGHRGASTALAQEILDQIKEWAAND